MAKYPPSDPVAEVIPTGTLLHLEVGDIKPSTNNPRLLFDAPKLETLKSNIRRHGVLVPITVYRPKGQSKYSILDGERRYKCVKDLLEEGVRVPPIPANVVQPPDPVSHLLYMFSIHNLRQQWELMPTALGLKVVMETLGTEDPNELSRLTSLSSPQIERCKILLSFDERFQKLSLDPDPKKRIPANFWIEAYPVINLCMEQLPEVAKLGRDSVIEKLVERYRDGFIKSVTHFRTVMEADEIHAGDKKTHREVLDTLQRFVLNPKIQVKEAFTTFVADNRRIRAAIEACQTFVAALSKSHIEFIGDEKDRAALMQELKKVGEYVEKLIEHLEGGDAPRDLFEAEKG
ncbi:MAG TPA: ParB N-terminal domain-containing protein [Terriglobales bacterium]|nr:ParB N-terminal domain-containing protein [Terriglobales bacterium]